MNLDIVIGGFVVLVGLIWFVYTAARTAGQTSQVASDDAAAQQAASASLTAATDAPHDKAAVEGALDAGKF